MHYVERLLRSSRHASGESKSLMVCKDTSAGVRLQLLSGSRRLPKINSLKMHLMIAYRWRCQNRACHLVTDTASSTLMLYIGLERRNGLVPSQSNR
jgi:hypothetical protein